MKLTALIALIAATVSLGGCAKGYWLQQQAHRGGHAEECICGVTYIQFRSGATVMVDREGETIPCCD